MRNALILSILFLVFSCKQNETAPANAPFGVTTKTFTKSTDLPTGQIAKMDFDILEFTGGNPSATKAINDSIQWFFRSSAGANFKLPFQVSLDSAAMEFGKTFTENYKDNTEAGPDWVINAESKILLLNGNCLSLEFNEYTYTGGAHPNAATILQTFDLATGKVLKINDLVKDTTLLLPMLEAGFRADKNMKPEESIGDYLYPDLNGKMPMPAFCCAITEGIRFHYNAYEIAPYVVGPTTIDLSWEQLGKLAEKSKWVD